MQKGRPVKAAFKWSFRSERFLPLFMQRKIIDTMPHILQPTEKIKVAVERQLVAAQREADAYAADAFAADPYRGTDLDTAFQAEADFDFLDVTSGHLLHKPDCPFCHLRRLKRAYGRITSKEEVPHGKAPH